METILQVTLGRSAPRICSLSPQSWIIDWRISKTTIFVQGENACKPTLWCLFRDGFVCHSFYFIALFRNTPVEYDGNAIWLVAETFINIVFMLEIAARVYMSTTLNAYISYLPNWFDVVSVIPYIIELITSAVNRRPVQFRFISSSPTEYLSQFANILKIVRMFKLVRRFPSAQVILCSHQSLHTMLLLNMDLFFVPHASI